MSACTLGLCWIDQIGPPRATLQGPLVINTWPFTDATQRAWEVLQAGGTPVDAVVAGCSVCEEEQCDGSGGLSDVAALYSIYCMVRGGSFCRKEGNRLHKKGTYDEKVMVESAVKSYPLLRNSPGYQFGYKIMVRAGLAWPGMVLGYGGSPDENGETTLDAMVMDGWRSARCQPNYWRDVAPDPRSACGPYYVPPPPPPHPPSSGPTFSGGLEKREQAVQADEAEEKQEPGLEVEELGDVQRGAGRPSVLCLRPLMLGTGDVVGDGVGDRVGDAPIAGAGAYVDSDVGACGATGDGDVMMRFLPCYQVVESMRLGMAPKEAAEDAILRIARKYSSFQGAIFAVNKTGHHAGACNNWTFQYSVKSRNAQEVQIITVAPQRRDTVALI
eukprot:jgi/Mesen1/8920/ME000548S08441